MSLDALPHHFRVDLNSHDPLRREFPWSKGSLFLQ